MPFYFLPSWNMSVILTTVAPLCELDDKKPRMTEKHWWYITCPVLTLTLFEYEPSMVRVSDGHMKH
jgi:hypothetical protein